MKDEDPRRARKSTRGGNSAVVLVQFREREKLIDPERDEVGPLLSRRESLGHTNLSRVDLLGGKILGGEVHCVVLVPSL